MADDKMLEHFYEVIDSNFADYEASGRDENVYTDMKNNIAKEMLFFFKAKYGEEGEYYRHCSVEYMRTINDCVNGYLQQSPQKRTNRFHSYFYPILKKAINESCRLDREQSSLSLSFGEELERSSAARKKLHKIAKLYEEILNYYDYKTYDEIVKAISLLGGFSKAEVELYIPLINSRKISISMENREGEVFSPIDSEMKVDYKNMEVPEELIISRESMKSILDKIDTVYQEQDDKEFLSTVITFKVLSIFESNLDSKTNNKSGTVDVVSYLPKSYDLEKLLGNYEFIDAKLVQEYFKGKMLMQKDLERSQGSVNNKWKQFTRKLLKKYRGDFEELRYE